VVSSPTLNLLLAAALAVAALALLTQRLSIRRLGRALRREQQRNLTPTRAVYVAPRAVGEPPRPKGGGSYTPQLRAALQRLYGEREIAGANGGDGAVAVQAGPVDEASGVAAEPVEESCNILLVEDDDSLARYYALLFEARGYSVRVAPDGDTGVQLATRLRPALIILDVLLARRNGMMALQMLRAAPGMEATPIVVLSNFSEPALVQRALELGAVEYVVKTQVRAESLANALPKWIQRERAFA